MRTNLKELREKLGMRQAEFARRLKVSRQAVCSWESGLRTPSVEQATKIADLLGCSLDDLVKGAA